MVDIETDDGRLVITDDELTLRGGREEITIPLKPFPPYVWTRGLHGTGGLQIAGHVLRIDTEQAPDVLAELARLNTGDIPTPSAQYPADYPDE